MPRALLRCVRNSSSCQQSTVPPWPLSWLFQGGRSLVPLSVLPALAGRARHELLGAGTAGTAASPQATVSVPSSLCKSSDVFIHIICESLREGQDYMRAGPVHSPPQWASSRTNVRAKHCPDRALSGSAPPAAPGTGTQGTGTQGTELGETPGTPCARCPQPSTASRSRLVKAAAPSVIPVEHSLADSE